MTLREARCTFSHLLAKLVIRAFELGYEAAFDEVTERITAKDKTSDHMTGSLHHMGLAADILLYKGGIYLTESDAYLDLGMYWKSLDPLCMWGGHFKNRDGNHFSFAPPELVGNRK